jgi:predicted transcriptional regulator
MQLTKLQLMSNAERFIDIYNKLDKILKDIDDDHYQTFSSKVKNSKNPIIKNFKMKLIDYGELRNAIVHNPKIGGKYIAEPIEEIVEDFHEILKKLQNPKIVIPLFQCEVIGRKKSDRLDSILKTMKESSFSQFPVFDENGKMIEIINTNTITRWLGRNISNDEIITENPKIEDLLQDIEFKKNYMFISRNCDIYKAYSFFVRQIEQNSRNLDALLITNSGNENEKLLGIITIEDIASKI